MEKTKIKTEVKKEIEGMFDGPILKLLVRLAFPIFAGMIFQLLYNVTDTLWVSRIDLNDPSYVGAAGIVFPFLFIAIALANGIMVGISSLVARAIGEKNHDILNRTAESGLAVAIGISVIIIPLAYIFDEQIIRLLGAKGDYYTHALEYFRFIIPAGILFFICSVFNGILQGEGLMKYVMHSMIIGTVGNIILDPVFIFLLKMNIRGAALATTISEGFVVIYVISIFIRKKTLVPVNWKISSVSLKTMGKISSIGFPQALGQMIMALSFLIFNRVVVSIDQLALTSFSLCGRFDQIVLMPIFAIGSALLTMIGQNAGRGNFDRINQIWKKGILSAFSVVVLLASAMVLLAPVIYPFFSKVDRVVSYAVLQTRILEFSFLFAVVGILARSMFQAIGYPIPALIIVLLRLVVVAIPAVYIYVYVLDMKMYGVWLGLITGNCISAVISIIWANRVLKLLKTGKIKVAGTT